jgi:transcriptional regulator of acetoin/glycerol metabolism
MAPDDRIRQIAEARHAVLEAGSSSPEAMAGAWHERAWLERSWRRCLSQGQRPDQAVSFDMVPAAARRRAEDAHHALLQAARPEMQRLARAVAPIRYFAILTDAQGTVVETAGAIDRSDRRAEAIARVGVDLSERSIGTSAISAALGEQRAVWLHRGEHFFRDTSVYSCAGAPLFGHDGRCVGMLDLTGVDRHHQLHDRDLTGVDVDERPELQHLVARAARSIGNALVHGVPHALRLGLTWADALPGEARDDALLCLDAEGAVVSANAGARQMLPRLGDLAHGPVHASDLFAVPWSQLFDLRRRGGPLDVPLWSGLRVSAQALPPLTDASAVSTPSPGARPSLKALENTLIHQAVRDAGGNVAEAARALGLSRATVYRRLHARRSS